MTLAKSSTPKFFQTIPRLKFNEITIQVINELEGGYFHPKMITDNRVKDPKGLYTGIDPKTGLKKEGISPSGETMFGIDRRNGIGLRKNAPQEWDEFFGILEKANAPNTWKFNSKGPTTDPNYKTIKARLTELASSIIYPEFNRLSNLYLDSEAYNIVTKDPRLLFHMSYAVWNGAGWFKKYATFINNEIKNGDTNPDSLASKAVDLRINEGYKTGSKPNTLIAQTGVKIKTKVFPQLLNSPSVYKSPAMVDNQTEQTQTKNQLSQQETTLYKQVQQPSVDTTYTKSSQSTLSRLEFLNA